MTEHDLSDPTAPAGGGPAVVPSATDRGDTDGRQELEDELTASTHHLERAHRELQATSDALESTNQELQSAIEALEATAEELWSTKEELELLDAELQSTDQELQRAKEELRTSVRRLDEANGLLEGVLDGVQRAALVVDADFVVQAWNGGAEEMWGLRRDEAVGRNVLGLDLGLATHELGAAVRSAFGGPASPLEVDVRTDDGCRQRLTCRTLVGPRGEGRAAITGVLVLMGDELAGQGDGGSDGAAAQGARSASAVARDADRSTPDGPV